MCRNKFFYRSYYINCIFECTFPTRKRELIFFNHFNQLESVYPKSNQEQLSKFINKTNLFAY